MSKYREAECDNRDEGPPSGPVKHRQNKNLRQRVIVFVGSPLEDTSPDAERALIHLAKRRKKNNIALDLIAFGPADVYGRGGNAPSGCQRTAITRPRPRLRLRLRQQLQDLRAHERRSLGQRPLLTTTKRCSYSKRSLSLRVMTLTWR
ncbi:hypothetical protein EDB89DRAFT_1994471 [Lactarius sanguifluus]|nr:hypothetical protein EDB89DRAFT_2012322 [Lactarius sanguifluus]KAH9167995.1 hypothetical protein EDB89DRAFT_1994471 [Lactarius sanguifluus]